MPVIDFNTNNESFVQFAKVIALFFAMFHLLVGFVLVRRVARINSILHTKRSTAITFIGFIYIAILIAIIGLVAVL